jgi:hypothetical protein
MASRKMNDLEPEPCSRQAKGRDPEGYPSGLLERCLPFLERLLTRSRLQHSLGVMEVMADLAAIYGLDREPAVTAGLLHDAARDLAPKAQLCPSQPLRFRDWRAL